MDNKLMEPMVYLFDRWQDERRYENFNDYINYMKKITTGLKYDFVSLTKRPFQLTYMDGSKKFKLHITASRIRLIEATKK